jgi:hypothetical protein
MVVAVHVAVIEAAAGRVPEEAHSSLSTENRDKVAFKRLLGSSAPLSDQGAMRACLNLGRKLFNFEAVASREIPRGLLEIACVALAYPEVAARGGRDKQQLTATHSSPHQPSALFANRQCRTGEANSP